MTKRLLLSLVVLISLLSGRGRGDASVGSRAKDELPFAQHLQKVLDLLTDFRQGTGVSAAIIIPEQGSWVGTSGISGVTTPIRPDMLFNIASIGKNYLAALILQLAEEGKLMLDDPIHKWLPDYPNVERTITARQLLNHTSGVFDWVEHPQSPFRTPYNAIDFSRIWTQGEVLRTLVDRPYSPPGTGWHYSTTNYNLLKMIAEKITQSKVSIELRKRFLEPLNLNHTLILDSETSIPDGFDIAHGWYDADGDGTLDDISSKARTWIATLSPAMMYSTAQDLARWSQALYQGEVLGQEYLEQMLTFHRPTPGEPPVTGYGLGTAEFAHKTIQGLRAWGHLGWDYGYMAAMLYLPEDSASVVILINDNNQDCITYVGLGLWLVIKFHNSKTRFIAAGYSLLLFLSMFVV